MIYTMDNIGAFCTARETGRMVEVDKELWYYFLEVLPPVHMRYEATVRNAANDGDLKIIATFGFAEGAERVTAFWQGWGPNKGRYYAQLTQEVNRS